RCPVKRSSQRRCANISDSILVSAEAYMPHTKYAIVGGGMTADSAVKGIREVDANGEIAVFSAEPNPPYDRPPLTKGLWKGKPVDKIWRHTDQQAGVDLHTSCKIVSLDAQNK